jgi:LacI family transcriptional regulator
MTTTLQNIADAAGVSLATASRALNGSNRVAKKTEQLIKKLAVDMQYTPNLSARVLAGKSSKLIGIITRKFPVATLPE